MAENGNGKNLPWRERARNLLEDLEKKLTETLKNIETTVKDEMKLYEGIYAPKAGLYNKILCTYFLLHTVLGGVAVTLLFYPIALFGLPINAGLTLLLLQAAHFLASLRIVPINVLAGIFFFGRPVCAPNSGLYIVPFFILSLASVNKNYKDIRFPGHPDKIFRVSENLQNTREGGDMPKTENGEVRPILVTTGEPKYSDEETRAYKEKDVDLNPLDRQLSIEVSFFARYRPHQEYGGIFRVTRNLSFGDDKAFHESVVDLLREQAELDIREIFSTQTYVTITENLDLINRIFQLKTAIAVLRLGIDIQSAGVVDLNPSHKTNSAQMGVPQAEFKRRSTIIEAEGQKKKDMLGGEGRGHATQKELEGLGKGYEAIKKNLGISGDAVIASETAKKALADADSVIVGTEGVAQLFGLVKAGQEALARPRNTHGSSATETSTTEK